jgi:septal ring factor EnvC (AmiA/AmiB activator)
MGEGNLNEKKDSTEKMKQFFIKYFREILILVFGVILTILLLKIYNTNYGNSELIKFKLETLDKEIELLNKQRQGLDSSINIYNKNIKKIDSSLNKLKIERTTINNFFDDNESKIKNADAKTVDSLLRLRYKY